MEQTATADFGLRITRWIWVLPVVVAAACALPLADSLLSWLIAWVYLFLPQFLILGVVIAEKISVPSLVGAAIAAGVLAAILCWLAGGLGPGSGSSICSSGTTLGGICNSHCACRWGRDGHRPGYQGDLGKIWAHCERTKKSLDKNLYGIEDAVH